MISHTFKNKNYLRMGLNAVASCIPSAILVPLGVMRKNLNIGLATLQSKVYDLACNCPLGNPCTDPKNGGWTINACDSVGYEDEGSSPCYGMGFYYRCNTTYCYDYYTYCDPMASNDTNGNWMIAGGVLLTAALFISGVCIYRCVNPKNYHSYYRDFYLEVLSGNFVEQCSSVSKDVICGFLEMNIEELHALTVGQVLTQLRQLEPDMQQKLHSRQQFLEQIDRELLQNKRQPRTTEHFVEIPVEKHPEKKEVAITIQRQSFFSNKGEEEKLKTEFELVLSSDDESPFYIAIKDWLEQAREYVKKFKESQKPFIPSLGSNSDNLIGLAEFERKLYFGCKQIYVLQPQVNNENYAYLFTEIKALLKKLTDDRYCPPLLKEQIDKVLHKLDMNYSYKL